MTLTVLSIDIGVLNLGMCVAELSDDFKSKEIIWIDLIDITQFIHRDTLRSECPLHHTRNFADWVEHMVHDNRQFFDAADLILIEKQPPQGFVVIEQLLFGKFRHKTQLVNPRRVHRYLNMCHLNYDQRKEYSVKIATRVIPDHLIEQLSFYHRQHDIADSVCIVLYYAHQKADEWVRNMRRECLTRDTNGMNVMDKLELFRF